ncbi:MAG: glycogen synthase GlgA [Ruminococcaceae bacterium]|nr:glycogen synthase GlgA [Oscillospiraceae bacterium]
MQILFASFEAEPFSKTGGLGDVAGSLPGYIQGAGYDIRVILPKLSSIPARFVAKMEPLDCFEVQLSWRRQYCGLLTMKYKGVTYYFIDNEYYFKRDQLYGEYDDGERIAFFSKAILESILHIPDFMPDVLHCNDWHTALTPVYLREHYRHIPGFDRMKTVFTVHNLKFQGVFAGSVLGDVLGLHDCPAAGQLMYGDAVNFMQGAIRYSDRLSTVSPTYAEEICTPYYGEGMDWLFNARREHLYGILNGIDYKKYDPKSVNPPFDAENMENKRVAKEALQADLGLEVDGDIPMFVVVSRLTEQKGFDLVTHVLPQICERKMQLVVLGVGTPNYEEAFRWYANLHPEKIAACITFDEPLSRRLYACGDVLLMPSRFEPCGLAQMMSMRYGCLPLVRETGGLKDSVTPYNQYTGEGNGFTFTNYNADEMMATIDTALDVWHKHHEQFQVMQKTAMETDFSWRASARKYREMYCDLVNE